MVRPRSGSAELLRAAWRAVRRHRGRAGALPRGHVDHAVVPTAREAARVRGERGAGVVELRAELRVTVVLVDSTAAAQMAPATAATAAATAAVRVAPMALAVASRVAAARAMAVAARAMAVVARAKAAATAKAAAARVVRAAVRAVEEMACRWLKCGRTCS